MARWITPRPQPQVTAQDRTAAEDALPRLAGVDQDFALGIVQNDRRLYRRLLAMFLTEYQRFETTVTDALHQADWPLAMRLAHTLKGASGTIGATQLAAAAGLLEAECTGQARVPVCLALLSDVGALLRPLIAALQQSEPGAETPGAQAAPAPTSTTATRSTEVEAGLARLRKLLHDDDADAGDALEELVQHLAADGDPLAHGLSAVHRAIERIDFDTALQALGRLAPARVD